LNSSIYLKNDFNNDNNEIQSPAKKFKSNFKDKIKVILYDYKEEKTNYNFVKKNVISKKNSASEYKNKTELKVDINNEIKINPFILNFSEISLDDYIVRALKKIY
jgi:hypothetical protein